MVRLRLIPSVVPSVYFIAAFLSCWRGGEILRARGIPGHNPGRIASDEPFLQGLSATDTYFASHEPSPRFSGFEAEGGGLLDVVNPAFWDAAKYLKLAEVPVEGNTALLDDEETLNDSDKMIQVEATPSVDYLTVEEVIPGSVSSNHSTTAPEVGNEHAISLRARKDGTEVEDASSGTNENSDHRSLRGPEDNFEKAPPSRRSSVAREKEESLDGSFEYDSIDIVGFFLFLWSVALEKLKGPASFFFDEFF